METQVVDATEYRNVSLSLLNESRTNPRHTFEEAVLKEPAVSIRNQGDTDAITAKVRQEFAARDKAKKAPQPFARR